QVNRALRIAAVRGDLHEAAVHRLDVVQIALHAGQRRHFVGRQRGGAGGRRRRGRGQRHQRGKQTGGQRERQAPPPCGAYPGRACPDHASPPPGGSTSRLPTWFAAVIKPSSS